MPVYEYRCNAGHEYEKTEGFDAPSVQKCVNCGATARRKISMPSVIFKGRGFYSTDNRPSSGSSESSAGANGHKPEAGSGSDKSPAADPPAKVETPAD